MKQFAFLALSTCGVELICVADDAAKARAAAIDTFAWRGRKFRSIRPL